MHRSLSAALVLLVLLPVGKSPARAADSAPGPKDPAADAAYPDEVSLLQNRDGEWTYLQAKGQHPLYVSDRDSRGHSTCYAGCASKWIPLIAPPGARPLGEWTPVRRKGDELQWTYRHRPVYLLVHDSNETPLGDGRDGHHLLPVFR